jgi:hypothetical protein
MPKTATKEGGRPRRWPVYAVVAILLVALVLVVEAFLRDEAFVPGEEISTPAVRDVAVSAENSLYPPPDVGSFGWRPKAVYVYLSVEDLPAEGDEPFTATVERSGSRSALGLLPGLSGPAGGGLRLADSGEDRVSRGSNGATGVIKFVLTDRSGGPLPAGNYTVSFSDAVGGEPGVEKRFSVGG